MELRSNHHIHYISAIKGDKVFKILNVTRGRPSLSFKEMSAILDHESNTKALPLANRSLHLLAPNMDKADEETVNDNYIGGSSGKRSHNLDDIFLGEMTLKQLKKKCKAKGRKSPISVEKKVKQEYEGSPPEEDNLDLEETLVSLKRKVSGKSKPRKMQKCGPGLKTIAVVKCEPVSFDEYSSQVSGDINLCATTKVEVSEPDCSSCQEVTSSEDSYTTNTSEHGMVCTGNVIGEMQLNGESCTKEEDIIMEGPIVFNADPVSCEHHKSTKSLPPEIPFCEEMMKVDDLGIIEKIVSEVPSSDVCLPREESSLIAEDLKVCVLNKFSAEFEQDEALVRPECSSHGEDLKAGDLATAVCSSREESSLIAEDFKVRVLNKFCTELEKEDALVRPECSSHEEDLKADDPATAVEQPIIMPVLTQEDKAITDVLTCNESPDILFPLCDGSAWYSQENKSTMHCSMSPEPADQARCRAASSQMRPVESCSDGGASPTMVSNEEYIIPASGTSTNSPNSGLNATRRCARPMNHVSEAVPGNCDMPVTVEVDAMDDTDKVSRSFASRIVECFELQHPPERLLSARKMISPESQQKLCRAMKSLELPDYQETEKVKQELHFEKQEVNADASSNVVRGQVLTSSTVRKNSNTADTSPNSDQKKKKGMDDQRRVRPKGVNKVAPPTWYRLSSACGCIQSCSQNVIDFSQQQMTDIERLAVNLTKELRSMKELMVGMLQTQGRRATISKNEMRVAVENATKVEDTARRSLATMTRDCNRFCKIVSLAEKNSASVGNSPGKEVAENGAASAENSPNKEETDKNDAPNITSERRKKITFADESGGRLCNIRFMEDGESLLSDSTIENVELHSA